jgi:predicted nucleotidyltransferase component of viral defense system
METSYFNLTKSAQKSLIQDVALKLNLSDIAVEKDLWLCWVLGEIFKMPFKMAFKGGTSLSKVYQLISRFSEDIDITLDYRNFISESEVNNATRSQLKKKSLILKSALEKTILEYIIPALKESVRNKFQEKEVDINLDDDGEKLYFYYPSLFVDENNYYRDHLLIEFGVRNVSEPSEGHAIKSLLSTFLDDATLALPEAKVETLSPIRTFWEKATLMHVECHRNRFLEDPSRLSRHWYDLYMLGNSWVFDEAILNKQILESVVLHKKAFFNASYAHYDDCLSGRFRLVPEEIGQNQLEVDYKKMKDAGMFLEEPPAFKDMITWLQALEVKLSKREKND